MPGTTVDNLDVAIESFLGGKSIQSNAPSRIETIIDPALEWNLPKSVDTKVRRHWEVMDDKFEELEGSEIALMPVSDDWNSTNIKDVILFNQTVTGGSVNYTDISIKEVYDRIEKQNQKSKKLTTLCGVIHLHPAGFGEPSPVDRDNFKKLAWRNMEYQNFYGWLEVTDEFGYVKSEKNIMKALKTKDAVLLADKGETRTFFKVKCGYSLFVIYNRNADPWIGVGECKKYCFDGGPESYQLLEEADGVKLNLTDDPIKVKAGPKYIEKQIAKYVAYHDFFEPERHVLPITITSMPFFYDKPAIVTKIEEELPMTAKEFINFLGDCARFKDTGPEIQAISKVHKLFSDQLNNNGGYDSQVSAVTKILRDISPQYDSAMKFKNGE